MYTQEHRDTIKSTDGRTDFFSPSTKEAAVHLIIETNVSGGHLYGHGEAESRFMATFTAKIMNSKRTIVRRCIICMCERVCTCVFIVI